MKRLQANKPLSSSKEVVAIYTQFNSFFPRNVGYWNQALTAITSSASLQSFRIQLGGSLHNLQSTPFNHFLIVYSGTEATTETITTRTSYVERGPALKRKTEEEVFYQASYIR